MALLSILAALAVLTAYVGLVTDRITIEAYNWTNAVAALPLTYSALLAGAFGSVTMAAGFGLVAVVGLWRTYS